MILTHDVLQTRYIYFCSVLLLFAELVPLKELLYILLNQI